MKRSSPKKADRTTLALAAIVGIVLFGSTILLCEVSGVQPGEQWPWWIDRALAIPIELTDVSDLRYYAIPVGLAALLMGLLLWWREPVDRNRGFGFEALAAVIVFWAVASAWVNGTWDQSRGWVFWLACGLGWAILLSRICSVRQVRGALIAGSVVAMAASILSLAHRQALGERFFQVPVGPITLTAALGALWSAVATVWLAGAIAQRRRTLPVEAKPTRRKHRETDQPDHPSPSMRALLWAFVVAVSSMLLLIAANRRGAWMGLMASWAAVAGIVLWDKCRTLRSRSLLAVVALVALAGAAWYVRGQARSAEVAASLPLRVRSIYWETMLNRIPDSPIWGIGPDRFVLVATSAQARRRAEEPKILHGTVDFDGHNEWLQAAFELGIPGGLFYLALPIAALIAGWRKWRQSEGCERVVLLALMAGLIEICVAEASSVNLRYPILPAWYWTLLGLTMALGRGKRPTSEDQGAASAESGARRVLFSPRRIAVYGAALMTAVTVLTITAFDLRAAMHHASGRALLLKDDARAERELEQATGRFGAARWISTRNYLAASRSNQLRKNYESNATATSMPVEADALGRRAVDAWGELFRASPGYLDTGFRLAEAQMMAGDHAAARATLSKYLGEINPYEKQGNILQVQIGELDAAGKLECIRRALRSELWDETMLAIATECLKSPDVASTWPQRVEQALQDVAKPSEKEWLDPLAPETLRIEAFNRIGRGDPAGAERVQYAAAQAYDRLAREYASVRRKWPAEVDGWYLAARFLFSLDPTQYREAFTRVSRAEFYVIDSIPTMAVPNAEPSAELVGGRIMPLEIPDKLSAMWRFSAMMHLAMKMKESQISLRINWSLPAAERSSNERVFAELGSLAAQLVNIFAPRPEAVRPPSFPLLVDLAKKYRPQ